MVLKRRLPGRFGARPIFVSPDTSLRYWKRNLEAADPALLDVVAEHIHAGEVVWDIGANVGLFTFAAAVRVGSSGRVLAVEPDTVLVELLRRSSELPQNCDLRVDVLPVAVADAARIVEFAIAKRGRSTNFISGAAFSTQTGGVREHQLVAAVTLDWLLERYPAPRFVKIDVEGAESMVFRGAEKLLSQVRPVILCEVADQCSNDVTGILKKHGYALFDAEMPRERRSPVERASWNTLALPTLP